MRVSVSLVALAAFFLASALLVVHPHALSNEALGIMSDVLGKIQLLESRKVNVSDYVRVLDEAVREYQACARSDGQICDEELIGKLQALSGELDKAIAGSESTYYVYIARKVAVGAALALIPIATYVLLPWLISYTWLKTKAKWIMMPRGGRKNDNR
uniref:Transmembrane protein n=1 Tax=Fervidicoccus fontis TaxID=683846 RepID=A0A7C1HWR3_9CREN